MVAEFKVVRDILEKTGTPEQVKNLEQGVRDELNPEDRGHFDKLLAGTDGGKAPPLTGPGGSKMTPPRKPIPPGSDTPGGGFKSPIDPKFRNEIHRRESQVGNYEEISPDGKALGRYQMRKDALRDAGLIDKQGRWTGKHGVRSAGDFLNNPEAQERAFAQFMRRNEKTLQRNGAARLEGTAVQGIKGRFQVTRSGLLAAAHREGAGRVREYLDHQERHGWKSDAATFPDNLRRSFLSVETRLREFSQINHRR